MEKSRRQSNTIYLLTKQFLLGRNQYPTILTCYSTDTSRRYCNLKSNSVLVFRVLSYRPV
jgi:hypothetical protein